MEWSPKSATKAYLDTIKLCNKQREKCSSCETQEPESSEFISALAAGMSAKLMVEVTSEVSTSTVALAAAARQTGGKVVCIVPELTSNESRQAIEEDSVLNDIVEFKTGDPIKVLPNYENIDFSVVDCQTDDNRKLLEKLDVNTKRSVVVANNLVEGRKGLGGHFKGVENKANVRSINHPIGKGMEITMIGKNNNNDSSSSIVRRDKHKGIPRMAKQMSLVRKPSDKSRWIARVDEKSGEEHIYRVPMSFSL